MKKSTLRMRANLFGAFMEVQDSDLGVVQPEPQAEPQAAPQYLVA